MKKKKLSLASLFVKRSHTICFALQINAGNDVLRCVRACQADTIVGNSLQKYKKLKKFVTFNFKMFIGISMA